MNEFRFQTEVTIPDFPWKTTYEKKNMFIGSCFTENVGNKMAALKYEVDINPFGILYNPVSVANGIDFLLQKKTFKKEDLIQHDNLWHSFYHHGRFSSPDAEKSLQLINDRLAASSIFLQTADFLFVTFGTAWVYNFNETGQTVSNCHKIPAKKFSRKRLTVGEIVKVFVQNLTKLWAINPDIKIIFTVSPIRHWKDGATENQRSKATLILAIDKLTQQFGPDKCGYFPAYEIVMDELRDYRFYTDDMIHLTDLAVNYVWAKFQDKLIDSESQKISKQVQNIRNAVNHKPFNKFTNENLKFLYQTLQQTGQLIESYRFLNLQDEKLYLREQIKKIEANKKQD